MAFGRVGIDGVGLLGGSLGLALRSRRLASCVVGVGRSRERLEHANSRGISDSFMAHDTLSGPPWDVLVLAAPVVQIAACLERHLAAGLIGDETVITDVGSTKSRLISECMVLLGERAPRMVGAHPIAGSEKSGSDYADATLFENRLTILTPESVTNSEAVSRVRTLWESVGSRISVMTPSHHDELLAASSHLPHLTAAALCALMSDLGEDGESVLGTGFKDLTRIASGSPGMWRDITLHNREELVTAIERLRDHLGTLTAMIETADPREIELYFQGSKDWRDRLLAPDDQRS